MTSQIILSVLLWTGTAFAQDAADKPRIHHPPVVNTSVEHQSWMGLDARDDWRG